MSKLGGKQDGVASFFLILFLIISSTAFAEETATFDLRITKGTLALDRKDYTMAIENFKSALKEKPDDPSATLYLGIALCNSGNEKEGEKLLKKALKLEPLSARTNLELGILYYKRGIYDEAKDFFEAVKNLSPGTDLSDMAKNYIREIERKEKRGKITEKNWAFSLTGGLQYDSNVILEPSDGTLPQGISRKSDWRGIIYLDAKYTPALTDNFSIGPTYSFYQSLHKKLDDFNVQQYLPGLMLNYTISKNLTLRAQYTYEWTSVGGEHYLSSHTVLPVLTIAEGKGFFTFLSYRYQNKDFKNTPLFETNTERNGSNNLIGITQYIRISRATLSLGYSHDVDTTDTNYWSYKGNSGDLDLRFDLGEKWVLDLSGKYYQKDYKAEYPGTIGKRKDKTTTYSANLTKTFGSNFDITAGWLHENNDSNTDIFEYKRDILTFLMRVHL